MLQLSGGTCRGLECSHQSVWFAKMASQSMKVKRDAESYLACGYLRIYGSEQSQERKTRMQSPIQVRGNTPQVTFFRVFKMSFSLSVVKYKFESKYRVHSFRKYCMFTMCQSLSKHWGHFREKDKLKYPDLCGTYVSVIYFEDICDSKIF